MPSSPIAWRSRFAIGGALVSLLGCTVPSPERGEERGPMVARFGKEAITADQLDARILSLPPSERPTPGEDLDRWYREQIRELAIERTLRADAIAADLEGSEAFQDARSEVEAVLTVQLCSATLSTEVESVDENDLRIAWEEHAEELAAPERRSLYHLFLRAAPGTPAHERRSVIGDLRDRVLRGESFRRLAAELSDSESRHRDGWLGWVIPGELPPGLDRVVFALAEGVPSEPVASEDGFHLFLVDQVLPARRLDLDEARPILAEHLAAERREAALSELETAIAPPPGSVILDRAGFFALSEDDDDAVVLRVGEMQLTLGDLHRRLRQNLLRQPATRPRAPSREIAWQLLTQLRRRELIGHDCRSSGRLASAGLEEELEEALDRWRDRALVAFERQQRLVAIAERDEARLRGLYESEIGSFSEPPRWHLRRLSIALDGDAHRRMPRLEEAASAGAVSLDALRDELGGEIDDLGFTDLATLGRMQPKLPALVAPLAVGGLSAPYRTRGALEIVELVARTDGLAIPFEEARERIAAVYVERHTAELYRQLSEEILARNDLQILPDGLAAMRQAGLPRPGDDVDALAELLGSL